MDQHGVPSKKICLFGGTFDPIHLGHTHIAQEAVTKLGLDQVVFLPCRQSPHKTGQKHASARDRLAMCRLATAEFPWAIVDELDLVSPPPSYSWRTAETTQKRHPNARLYWLMGTDQWESLPQWSQPEKLAQLVEFIVFTRGTSPEPRPGFRMHSISGDHPASATAIRKHPNSSPSIHWLHPEVKTYLQNHTLYTPS